MKVQVSKYINAPVDVTFDVFSDVERTAERIEGIKRVEILSDVKHGRGTRWRETRELFGQDRTEEMEIKAFQPNQSYEVVASSDGTDYHTTYTFTEKDGSTLVEMTFTGKPVSFMAKLLSPLALLMTNSTKKLLEEDIDQLKAICEQSTNA